MRCVRHAFLPPASPCDRERIMGFASRKLRALAIKPLLRQLLLLCAVRMMVMVVMMMVMVVGMVRFFNHDLSVRHDRCRKTKQNESQHVFFHALWDGMSRDEAACNLLFGEKDQRLNRYIFLIARQPSTRSLHPRAMTAHLIKAERGKREPVARMHRHSESWSQ
jgi:hypothetical protein